MLIFLKIYFNNDLTQRVGELWKSKESKESKGSKGDGIRYLDDVLTQKVRKKGAKGGKNEKCFKISRK